MVSAAAQRSRSVPLWRETAATEHIIPVVRYHAVAKLRPAGRKALPAYVECKLTSRTSVLTKWCAHTGGQHN
jgi:hypothetical protein